MILRQFGRTVTVAALMMGAAWPVLAAEGEGKSGMPQFDPAVFAPQLFWLAILFALLYLLMSKLTLPTVGKVIEQRRAQETADLTQAEAFKAEADRIQAAYSQALAQARAEAQSVLAKANADIAAKSTARQHELAQKIAERLAQAEARIAEARKAALGELTDIAGELVCDLTDRLAGIKVTAGDAKKAVKSVANREQA